MNQHHPCKSTGHHNSLQNILPSARDMSILHIPGISSWPNLSLPEIDDAVTTLHRMTAELLRKRNRMAPPISRLPVELLQRILLETRGEFSLWGEAVDTPHDPIRWTAITHVCHDLRVIALRTPELWTFLDLSYPRWANASITRCTGALPLSVLVVQASDYSLNSVALDLFLQVAPRTQQLILRARDYMIDEVLARARQASLLDSLRIIVTSDKSSPYTNFRRIDSEVLDLNDARLHELSIKACILRRPTEMQALRHIRSFTAIKTRFIRTNGPDDILGIIEALECMHGLESLTLINTFVPVQELPPGYEYVAILPRLKSLEIEDEMPLCTMLLEHLPSPLEQLRVRSATPTMKVVETHFPRLVTCMQRFQSQGLNSATEGINVTNLKILASSFCPPLPPHPYKISLALSCDLEHSPRRTSSTITADVEGTPVYALLKPYLEGCQSFRVILVNSHGIPQAFYPSVAEGAALPQLRHVTVEQVARNVQFTMGKVVAWLGARKAHGLDTPNVVFRDCDGEIIDGLDMEAFSKLLCSWEATWRL